MNESLVLCVTSHWVRTQDEEGGCRILECRLESRRYQLWRGRFWRFSGVAGKSHGLATQVVRWVTWDKHSTRASSPHGRKWAGLLDKLWICDCEYLSKGGNNPVVDEDLQAGGRKPVRGNWQGIWGEVCAQVLGAVGTVWASSPESFPNVVMTQVPSFCG